MKKFLKKIKKSTLVYLTFILVGAVAIIPLIVSAATTATLTVSFDQTYNSSNGKVQYKNSEGTWIDVTSGISNVNATAIRVADVTSGYTLPDTTVLRLSGNAITNIDDIYTSNGYALSADGNYALENVNFTNSNTPQNGNFDNTAWFIWNCNNNLCKKKVENLTAASTTSVNGIPTVKYVTNYIKQSTIVDGNNVLDISSLGNFDYAWINSSNISQFDNKTTWEQAVSYLDGLDYEVKKSVAYDPCGALKTNNSISTNGDRVFRATIYNDNKYYGITNATDLNDLTYVPSFWDATMFNPATDISSSTLTNPAVIETYLLEPKIVLTNDSISTSIDSVEVASEVPSTAVTITKNNNKFEIKFNSTYYDHVVFKITSGTKTYYVMISRITIDSNGLEAQVLVPTDAIKNYDVMATYYFANGDTKRFMLEYNDSISGGIGITNKIYKLSSKDTNSIDLSPSSTNAPIGVSYIVMQSGSTSTLYNGTLSGSKNGTYFKLNQGIATPDYTK